MNKKMLFISLIFVLCLNMQVMIFSNVANAVNDGESFKYILDSSKSNLYSGDTFNITVSFKDFENINDGIVAVTGQLQYDDKLIEIVPEVTTNEDGTKTETELIGKNNWNFTYNKANKKFVGDSTQVKSNQEVFKVTFKVKSNITKDTNTVISMTNLEASEGKGIINVTDAYTINVNLKPGRSMKFDDVKPKAWFYGAVEYVFENNMVSGLDDRTFGPNVKLTRGMLVTILYRMEGMPEVTGKPRSKDVTNPKAFYYTPIKWAEDHVVVSGYENGNFGPNDLITREQLAVILNNYARYKQKDTSKTSNLSEFKDTNKISNFAVSSMKWAVGSGVINGNGDKTLDPRGNATRAEAAAMLAKYCIFIGR